MHQAASHGARRARYRGLPKTRLDHVYMACALNLLRLEACRHPVTPSARPGMTHREEQSMRRRIKSSLPIRSGREPYLLRG